MKTVAGLGIVALVGLLSFASPVAGGQRGGGHSAGATPAPSSAGPPSSAGLSISRPIGQDISSVQTTPPPGISAPVRSPFDARPRTYSRPSSNRGLYGGTVGYFGAGGDMDHAITIRTLVFNGDEYSFQAGAGIVADSVPETEYEEVLAKSGSMVRGLELAEKGL